MALKPDKQYKIRSVENDTKPINKRHSGIVTLNVLVLYNCQYIPFSNPKIFVLN